MERGAARLKEAGMRVDYILTHTPAPGMGIQSRERGEAAAQLYAFFTAIAKQVDYKKWFFGCIHQDRKITARHCALFEEVLAVEEE